ncbi:metallophosphoesterase [Aeromicrobium sp.]|uniref:metallophosphoesterase n=1 Tax=Aeromicrobium sp. TaxID=1871063 RepID=UPI0035128E3A
MKRGLVASTCAALVLAACSPSTPQETAPPEKGTGTTPTFVVLNPTPDPATSQTVTWRSREAFDDQRVVARPVGGGPQVRAEATRKAATSVRDSGSALPAYTATLRGLQPGTRYRYRVENAGGTAGPYTFRTPRDDDAPWTFLALGDTQVDNADVPARIVREAVDEHPEANLVLHAGDVVNEPWRHGEWVDLMKALAPVRTSRNLAVSIGNHERCILVRGCRSGGAEGFRTYFTDPGNDVDGQQPTWYSFDQQGVRFVVLDSFGTDLEAQARFLDERLADNPNRWSVVLMHAGPFASRVYRTNTEVFSTILPVVEKHDVDLFLNGHDHVYTSGYHGDPDATVFAVSDSGPKYYQISGEDWTRRGATRTRWAKQVSTYQVVDVGPDVLHYRAVVAANGAAAQPRLRPGTVLDDVTIRKDAQGTKTVTRR